jgi:AraC-like DNA-binding protein
MQFSWNRNLFIGISLFCISYFTNYILGLNSYILGPIFYSFSIYYISFLVFSRSDIFGSHKKYSNLNISNDQADKLVKRIEEIMKFKQSYLEADFSLSRLSELTSIPNYMLSNLLSEKLNQNFNDYTNKFRIEVAKKKLSNHNQQHHKISAIAYECGFNTLSSFNQAFKKFTLETPSEFRKRFN